nr:hypothetical protein Itr_chr01CG20090 [Ipomoea trifida]GMC47822.1 hypothetical protein Iba_chr01aCG15000 [Ipomoea batatas]
MCSKLQISKFKLVNNTYMKALSLWPKSLTYIFYRTQFFQVFLYSMGINCTRVGTPLYMHFHYISCYDQKTLCIVSALS